MMKTISVSTAVFAEIWSNREDGEESENQILARILDCPEKQDHQEESNNKPSGFYDKKYDVFFPEGFQIFRTYNGTDYRAVATKGFWFLEQTNKYYETLNKLSEAVVTGRENAWKNWNFTDEKEQEKKVSDLRPEAKIKKRTKPAPQTEAEWNKILEEIAAEPKKNNG